jgi:O-succinylhomoserine sulfhydrylase
VLYPHRADHPQAALAKRQMPEAGGSLVTFDLAGGKEAAFRFCDALGLIDISNNLGDSKSLVTHPATTTHMRVGPEERARLSITDGTIRLSVGLEDVDDLIEDLAQALDTVSPPRPRAKRVAEVAPAAAPATVPEPMTAAKPASQKRRKPAEGDLFTG